MEKKPEVSVCTGTLAGILVAHLAPELSEQPSAAATDGPGAGGWMAPDTSVAARDPPARMMSATFGEKAWPCTSTMPPGATT